MKIVVGLGNPGSQYAQTRHNIGWMVLAPARLPTLLLLIAFVAACGGNPPEATPAAPNGSPTASAQADAGLRYTCGSIPFDPAILHQPGSFETGGDPMAAALRTMLQAPDIDSATLPDSGWILVGASPTSAELVAPDPAGDFAYVELQNSGRGWEPGGWGGCVPQIVLEGRSVAEWRFDPAAPLPDADTTTFHALVTERACASGKPMGARLGPPHVVYGETEVLVVFSAQPLGGGQDCPSNPASAVEVVLREPLGERRLLDASVYPPADPTRRDP